MKSKQRLLAHIAVSLGVVVLLGIVLMLTFVSLLKKSKYLIAEESLKNAAVATLLFEGLTEDNSFDGYLVYYENVEDASVVSFRGIVGYAKINEKAAELVAEDEVDLTVVYCAKSSELPVKRLKAVAGIGVSDIIDANLHDTLLDLQVVYYKAVS